MRFASGERILIAEDYPDNQRLLSAILTHAGFQVTVAENGKVAYDKAMAALKEGKPFDLILMDVQMPIMDGWEATRRLRSEGYTRPIVALTANARAEDRQRCLDAGCDYYVTKPIDRDELMRVAANCLEGTDKSRLIPLRLRLASRTKSHRPSILPHRSAHLAGRECRTASLDNAAGPSLDILVSLGLLASRLLRYCCVCQSAERGEVGLAGRCRWWPVVRP